MRILIKLSPNTITVPYHYQVILLSFIHKWLGRNNSYHEGISLYGFSWLRGGRKGKKGYEFKNGAYLSINAYSFEFIQSIASSLLIQDVELAWGMEVLSVEIIKNPTFSNQERFMLGSPVFIKRKRENRKEDQFYYPYYDKDAACIQHNDHKKDFIAERNQMSNLYMTETLQRKLASVGLSTDISVAFDPAYRNPQIKSTKIKSNFKATYCPVIITGNPESILFAWNVGIGNNTGMGFGSLI